MYAYISGCVKPVPVFTSTQPPTGQGSQQLQDSEHWADTRHHTVSTHQTPELTRHHTDRTGHGLDRVSRRGDGEHGGCAEDALHSPG